MVVTDLDNLSLQELEYIANREGLKLDNNLTRSQIIDEIVDYYDDNNIQLKENKSFVGDDRRFISSLVSVKGKLDIKNINYAFGPKTSVHFLLESPSWAFIYWNISNRDLMEIKLENVENLILRCHTKDDNQISIVDESFDIEVGIDDNNWSLNFQRGKTIFSIELFVKFKNGEVRFLCESDNFKAPVAWYEKNYNYLKENEDDYKLALSSLVTKSGEIIDNDEIKAILKLVEGDK